MGAREGEKAALSACFEPSACKSLWPLPPKSGSPGYYSIAG